jgi:hypothetical protein
MNILTGFERSQEVLAAFMTLGHTGMSCDKYADGEKGLPHYRGDIFDVLGCGWDLVILHPPCTAIAVSGNRYYAGTQARRDAIAFVESLWFFGGYRGRLGLENPVGVLSSQSRLGKATQYIQPWQFGHPESKKTGLWLRDLPPLVPTDIVHRPLWTPCERGEEYNCTIHGIHASECDCPPIDKMNFDPYTMGGRYDNQTPSGQNKLGPSPDRQTLRSRTYSGIARAMAEQWGSL